MAHLIDRVQVREFLLEQPRLAIRPSESGLLLQGTLAFHVLAAGNDIEDAYQLKIHLPEAFPRAAPLVYEVGNKIPRQPGYHVNYDGTLCLGSPLRVLLILAGGPTLQGFATECLVPYLAAVSHRLRQGGELLFGELQHGSAGELEDYGRLLQLPRRGQVRRAIALLVQRRRVSNKRLCPCDCGRRLGGCTFHLKLLPLRKLASRRWFKERAIAVGAL